MTEPQRPWRDYFDNTYLKGDALPTAGRTYTIADKARDEVEGQDGKEHKLALLMTDGTRWLVNPTNATFMEHLFGTKFPSEWIGKRVTLRFDPTVKFGKDTVGGIRVMGSPDIDAPVTFEFQENSRKRPYKVTLVPTGTVQQGTLDEG